MMETQEIIINSLGSKVLVKVIIENPESPKKLIDFKRDNEKWCCRYYSDYDPGNLSKIKQKLGNLISSMDYLDQKLRKIMVYRLQNNNAWKPVPFFYGICRLDLEDEYSILTPGKYSYSSIDEFRRFKNNRVG